MINGKTLIAWGMAPGPHFAAAIEAANAELSAGRGEGAARAAALAFVPPPPLPLGEPHSAPHGEFIEPENDAERANTELVCASMAELSRTPTVVATAVMPDACPAGAQGTIPVGGIAATRNAIHPGMHSADICCSVAITVARDGDPARLMDAAHEVTHFGPSGRADNPRRPSADVLAAFEANPFLADMAEPALAHFATQGDGNHFLFVGRLASSGELAIVTHHGSRRPGALLYKRGMALAEAQRQRRSPETLKANAWIEADSRAGEDYWSALQAIRAWTKESHFAIHAMALERAGLTSRGAFWNEHNFVFRRGDVFLHGKGATPAWRGYAADDCGRVLIPLNMGAPILIAEGRDRADALGFAPHGAGRNISRSAHMRSLAGRQVADVLSDETGGLDVRFYCGEPDLSELPSAYKRADAIRRQIEAFGLARIVDEVVPYGSIMAGDHGVAFRKAGRRRR